MKSSAKSINLTSLDDLFSTEESRAEESCEKVVRIPLAELHPFPNHPFHVRDDEAMQNTVDSIKEYGVLTPGIVRPREDGGYEIVAGHRRKHGSELAGLSDMPCIVREMCCVRSVYEAAMFTGEDLKSGLSCLIIRKWILI